MSAIAGFGSLKSAKEGIATSRNPITGLNHISFDEPGFDVEGRRGPGTRAQKQLKTRENMQNHAKTHKNAQKHTKHTQKHMRTHNDDMSRVFGFGCDVGFDCGSCLGWTKHAGHVIPFAVQPMQEPQSKAISQPKPKNRDMSSCCVGATLPYLSCLRGGISKAASKKCPRDAQEVPKRGQKPPKSEQKPVK